MKTTAIKTSLFNVHDKLEPFIIANLKTIPEKSILAVTTKIVALAQGRVIPQNIISKKEIVTKEADKVLSESYKSYLTIKDNILIPAAGVDESNAHDQYILWPKDPYPTAHSLWLNLKQHYKLKELGIILTDSRCTPLRKGVSGVGVSYWGFKGVESHIGKPDLFGRPLTMSTTNVVDALAGAAVYVMGESNEQTPLALITDAPVTFNDETNPEELVISPEEDLFGPAFKY